MAIFRDPTGRLVNEYGQPVDQYGRVLQAPQQQQYPQQSGYPQPGYPQQQVQQGYPQQQTQVQVDQYGRPIVNRGYPQQQVQQGYPQPGYPQQTQQAMGSVMRSMPAPAVNTGPVSNATVTTDGSRFGNGAYNPVKTEQPKTFQPAPEPVVEKTISEEDLEPLPGNEFKPLVLPIYKVRKEIIDGKYFKYKIEEDEKVDKAIHERAYGKIALKELDVKTYTPKVKLVDGDIVENKLSEILAALYFEGVANIDNILIYKTLTAYGNAVKKYTNAEYEDFYTRMIKDSEDFNDLVKALYELRERLSRDEISKTAFNNINKFLTKRLNQVLTMKLDNAFTIDSLVEDGNDLIDYIKSNLSNGMRNIYFNGLVDFITSLKKDVEEFEEVMTSPESEVGPVSFIGNIEEMKKNGYSGMFIPESFYTIISMNDKMGYELESAGTEPMVISFDNVPILSNVIDAVVEEASIKDNEMYLIDVKMRLFKISKNKQQGKWVILKIGEG